MARETFGAIDIGSNTIKLKIMKKEYEKDIHNFIEILNSKIPIRLGEDVFNDGFIGKEKESHLIEIFKGISFSFKENNVNDYRAYATSAFREASNGKDIIKRIKKQYDINIEIINEATEADLIYEVSSQNHLIDKSKSYLYVDVGGGNTKVIVYSNGEKICSRSFKIGTVRLLSDTVQLSEITLFKMWLKGMSQTHSISAIIATGGNINTIDDLFLEDDKYKIDYFSLKKTFDNLQFMNIEQRIETYNLSKYRADVILPALYIFLIVSEAIQVSSYIIPKIELVDGIMYEIINRED
ncbi:MAG: hypothetical protein WC108_04055 [Bacteroidales bacterium]|nr:hypothetical protein [Bacteroidales bacterium]